MSEKEQTPDRADQRIVSVSRTALGWIGRMLQGVIMGIGAILPGISGGVLCVIFGIYQPMMALLAHPVKAFKTHGRLLLPVLIGFLLGVVGLAGVVNWMFRSSYTVAVWLFIGLICGMIPSLFRQVEKADRKAGVWVSLVVSAAVVLTVLLLLKSPAQISVRPNIWWYLVCGILWGISIVVPGLSSSSIFIYLGLYEPMTAGIKVLAPEVVIPLVAGILTTILALARTVDYLYKRHYSVASYMILGFVIASTIAIIPVAYQGMTEIILSAVCFAAGFAATLLMDTFGRRVKANS
jgi:putative membrane protein